MMPVRFIAFAFILATLPAAADTPACNLAYNGFAKELDALADKIDNIKETDKLCSFMRGTGLPIYQSIHERARSLVDKCERGVPAAEYARSALEREKAHTQETCAKAGM